MCVDEISINNMLLKNDLTFVIVSLEIQFENSFSNMYYKINEIYT